MKLDPRALIGFAVSGALLWWLFRDADLASIGHQLAAADPVMLVATGFILTTGGIIRAIRWRLLLEPLGAHTSLRTRWAALNIGFMATNLFPARLGELIRPLALSRMAPVSMSAALGTVVLERILDTVVIVTFALIIILSPSFPTGAVVAGLSVGSIVSGAAVVLALVLGLVVLAVFRRGAVMRVVRACLAVLPERAREAVAHRADALLSGLTMVRRPASLVRAMLWTVLLWLWMGSAFWTAFRAFGTPLGGFAPAMFTECSLSLFEVLPAGPGFIGTMQAGVLASVHTIYGVAADPALSMALGYFVAGFVPVTLIGLYYAWAVGLRIRSMGAAAETVLEAGGD